MYDYEFLGDVNAIIIKDSTKISILTLVNALMIF